MKNKLPKMVLENSIGLVYNQAQEGWKIVDNISLVEGDVLQFDAFVKRHERVSGKEMLRRGEAGGRLLAGQFHTEKTLSLSEYIPSELRPFKLAFGGTKWWDPNGDPKGSKKKQLVISILAWSSERQKWELDFDYLDGLFDTRYRLATFKRARRPSNSHVLVRLHFTAWCASLI